MVVGKVNFKASLNASNFQANSKNPNGDHLIETNFETKLFFHKCSNILIDCSARFNVFCLAHFTETNINFIEFVCKLNVCGLVGLSSAS